MKKTILLNKSSGIFILLSSIVILLLMSTIAINNRDAAAQETSIDEIATRFCDSRMRPDEATPGGEGISEERKEQRDRDFNACKKGFSAALTSAAVRPVLIGENGEQLPVNNPDNAYKALRMRPCATNSSLFPGDLSTAEDLGIARACQVGYIHAFANRGEYRSLPEDNSGLSEAEKLRRESDEVCKDYVRSEFPFSGPGERNTGPTGRANNSIAYVCSRGYIGAKQNKSSEEACGNYDGARKDNCLAGFTRGGGVIEDNVEQECGAGADFSLSWILCPIIETSLSFAETYFSKLEEYMQNVPINIENEEAPGYASYRAWQNFRILGNLVLVGAMLALVYGMIRNGGGGR